MCGLLRFHKGEVLLLQASPESQSPWRGSWTILDAFRVQSLQVNARVSLNSGPTLLRPHPRDLTPETQGLNAKSPTWRYSIEQSSILHVDGSRRGPEGTVPSAPYLGGKRLITPYFTPQAHATSRRIEDLPVKCKTWRREKKTLEDIIRALSRF